VCSASKDLWLAAKKMSPPWPNKAFNLEHSVRHVAFSPSGSQLAFCMNNRTNQCVAHIWDRWGKETLLEGHPGHIYCMEYSLDWEYLASGSECGSIHIWRKESFHTTFSQTHMERPMRTPKQADAILLGSRLSSIMALSFSRTDSNLLASGGSNGEIKIWNVKEQACVHSFDHGELVMIRSLFFAGGADIACLAATVDLSIIRLWRAEGTSDFASEIIGNADVSCCSPRAVFPPSDSFVATISIRTTGNVNDSTMNLYELETMTKTQSVVMSDCFACCVAVSPDSKQLVVVCSRGGGVKIDSLRLLVDLL
jgi:WD40 repeat protein